MLLFLTACEASDRNGKIEDLILKMAKGDTEALGSLYEEIKTDVYAFCLSRAQNVEDAEDICEDTFVRIYKYARLYTPKGKPMAWIFTVALNILKRHKAIKARHISYDDAISDTVDESQGIEEALSERSFLKWLISSLDELSRSILVMHAVSGLKHREIAKILDIPLATVLSKYNRAIKKLKNMAEGGGKSDE